MTRTEYDALGLDFDRRWSLPWSERIPLILPRSVEELERLLQATYDLDNLVARAVSTVSRT